MLGDGRDMAALDPSSVARKGKRLRRSGRVARVLCDVASTKGVEKCWKDSNFRR